jgi:putative transposase
VGSQAQPVRHDFTADAPNAKWSPSTPPGGKLYLCAVKECYSNKIVGYAIDSRMKSSLAASAIRNAIALRSPAGTILHSDRGSQFGSKKVRRLLDNNDLVGSMGRVGAACDNAAMESFFSLLQKNVLDTRRWETREELRPRDRHLDRNQVQPATTPTGPRQAHPGRV